MRKTPPNFKQLQLALALLEPTDAISAALHLSLPVGEVVPINAHVSGELISWRGKSARVSSNVTESVLELINDARNSGDVFLDLDAPPASWVKVVQSGVRYLAFGSDVLFGAPVFAATQAPEVLIEAVEAWRTGLLSDSVFESAHGRFLVESSANFTLLRPLDGCQEKHVPAGVVDDDEFIMDEISQSLGEQIVGSLWLGARGASQETEYYLDIQGWRAVVPVLDTGGTLLIGTQTYDLLEIPETQAPVGWEWRGWDMWSNSIIGEHIKSGMIARFTK